MVGFFYVCCMNVYHLKEHSKFCPCNTPHEKREVIETDSYWEKSVYNMRYVCEHTPSRFFFQLNGEFFMVVYYDCITHGDKIGFIVELLKNSLNEAKDKRLSNIKKSIPLKELIKEMKKGKFSFKNYHEEIVHIYNGSFKVPEYCIVRKTDYFNTIFSTNQFHKNYLKAIEYLKEHDLYETYGNYLWRIYELNLIPGQYYVKEKEVIQTTNLLIQQINKIANAND
jgi:hypothetical protein